MTKTPKVTLAAWAALDAALHGFPASSVGLALLLLSFVFFFNDTATTEIYTLSLHDALPIFYLSQSWPLRSHNENSGSVEVEDRKSTRLNSSHVEISYAVFCLKKKKEIK